MSNENSWDFSWFTEESTSEEDSTWSTAWDGIKSFFADDTEEDSSWDWLNSDTTWSFIGGAAGAGLDYYNNQDQLELGDKDLALRDKIATQNYEVAMGHLAAENQRNSLIEQELNDKIGTRRRHNETINAGPSRKPNTIKRI